MTSPQLLVSWVTLARLVRGEVLAIKQKEFVEAARAIGASSVSVILCHIVPYTLGPIIVVAAYIVPGAIISEAILSYLGIGIRPTVRLDAPFPTSWESMILEGSKAWESQPWMLIAPTLAVASITLAFTFVSDGMRDAFDPRRTDESQEHMRCVSPMFLCSGNTGLLVETFGQHSGSLLDVSPRVETPGIGFSRELPRHLLGALLVRHCYCPPNGGEHCGAVDAATASTRSWSVLLQGK